MALPDLRSRLAAGLVFALPAPDDAARRAILVFRAARRGLRLSAEQREGLKGIGIRAGRVAAHVPETVHARTLS